MRCVSFFFFCSTLLHLPSIHCTHDSLHPRNCFTRLAQMGESVIFIVWIITLASHGGHAAIRVTPSNIDLDDGPPYHVQITCGIPSGSDVTAMEFIRISRNTTSQPLVEQGLAFAYFLSRKRPGQATLVPPRSGGLAANTGIVSGGLTQKSITLTLLETSCEDAGIYHCYVSYQLGPFDNPDVIILNDYKTLTVTGGLPEIILDPHNLCIYKSVVGSMEISCGLPRGTDVTAVDLIRVSRYTTSQPGVEQGLALAHQSGAGHAVLVPHDRGGLAADTASVSGSVAGRSVTLTLLQAGCHDEGVYRCYISYQTGSYNNPRKVIKDTYRTVSLTGHFPMPQSIKSSPCEPVTQRTLNIRIVSSQSSDTWWHH
ncbi:uncharacterized protein LOC112568223 isoform X1 [Pomacea canaliculata]|uniref:uncharacterized protein LOC112568223 isoform X1 n=2 Tax=Pomacea canaliculata TaxID=400727 RepID=UPI000D73636E|nr:uncharacterized protein LOC112568223 isoform X1 [Pomacea canaliculata]